MESISEYRPIENSVSVVEIPSANPIAANTELTSYIQDKINTYNIPESQDEVDQIRNSLNSDRKKNRFDARVANAKVLQVLLTIDHTPQLEEIAVLRGLLYSDIGLLSKAAIKESDKKPFTSWPEKLGDRSRAIKENPAIRERKQLVAVLEEVITPKQSSIEKVHTVEAKTNDLTRQITSITEGIISRAPNVQSDIEIMVNNETLPQTVDHNEEYFILDGLNGIRLEDSRANAIVEIHPRQPGNSDTLRQTSTEIVYTNNGKTEVVSLYYLPKGPARFIFPSSLSLEDRFRMAQELQGMLGSIDQNYNPTIDVTDYVNLDKEQEKKPQKETAFPQITYRADYGSLSSSVPGYINAMYGVGTVNTLEGLFRQLTPNQYVRRYRTTETGTISFLSPNIKQSSINEKPAGLESTTEVIEIYNNRTDSTDIFIIGTKKDHEVYILKGSKEGMKPQTWTTYKKKFQNPQEMVNEVKENQDFRSKLFSLFGISARTYEQNNDTIAKGVVTAFIERFFTTQQDTRIPQLNRLNITGARTGVPTRQRTSFFGAI